KRLSNNSGFSNNPKTYSGSPINKDLSHPYPGFKPPISNKNEVNSSHNLEDKSNSPLNPFTSRDHIDNNNFNKEENKYLNELGRGSSKNKHPFSENRGPFGNGFGSPYGSSGFPGTGLGGSSGYPNYPYGSNGFSSNGLPGSGLNGSGSPYGSSPLSGYPGSSYQDTSSPYGSSGLPSSNLQASGSPYGQGGQA
ncbi:unnamed protein product, partial [Brachionus calyciflorus]